MQGPPGLGRAAVLAVLGHAAVLGYLGTRAPQPAPHGAAGAMQFTVSMRPAAVLQPAEVPQTEAAARIAAFGGAGPEQAAAPAAAASFAPPEQEQPYLPRGELTVPPRVVGMVDVPFPEDVKGIVDLNVKLTLFIDEHGTVQRLRIDTPDVHPSFERAIRDAFLAARFSPGELHQVPVRSQLRLEVSFQAPSAGSRRPPS